MSIWFFISLNGKFPKLNQHVYSALSVKYLGKYKFRKCKVSILTNNNFSSKEFLYIRANQFKKKHLKKNYKIDKVNNNAKQLKFRWRKVFYWLKIIKMLNFLFNIRVNQQTHTLYINNNLFKWFLLICMQFALITNK